MSAPKMSPEEMEVSLAKGLACGCSATYCNDARALAGPKALELHLRYSAERTVAQTKKRLARIPMDFRAALAKALFMNDPCGDENPWEGSSGYWMTRADCLLVWLAKEGVTLTVVGVHGTDANGKG